MKHILHFAYSTKWNWGDVQKQDNGVGSWSLVLSKRLDREDSHFTNFLKMKVRCTIEGDGLQQDYFNFIGIKVRDIDDTLPVLNFTAVDLDKAVIRKGDVLAFGTVTDKDSEEMNQLEVSVEANNLRMEISCNNSDKSDHLLSTLLYCNVIASESKTLKVDETINFQVVAVDSNLVPGYGADMVFQRLNTSISKTFTYLQRIPIYQTTTIVLPAKPRKWVRVTEPTDDGLFNFYTDSKYFNVTETQGIVYVIDGSQLDKDIMIDLTIWWNSSDISGTTNLTILMEEAKLGSCVESSDDTWCATANQSSICFSLCGNALKDISPGGGCHWVEHNKQLRDNNYTTCTASPGSCPNDVCDALERLHDGICPQDCKLAKYIFGAGSRSKDNITGIYSGAGICFLRSSDQFVHCSSQYILDNVKEAGTEDNKILILPGDLCDENCKIVVCVIASFAFTVVFITFFVIRERRKRQKACPPQPCKEDLIAINYEECIRPLQEPETPARPDYYDAKWEFPRHRLTIEETIGEGEFGMVLKARADGIHGHDGPKTVAVKTLKGGAKESELGDLVSELELLKDVDHPNVIKLLGACTIEDGPLYVIIEYAEHGSLRNFLKKHRKTRDEKDGGCYLESLNIITAKRVLTFAWHIAKGMAYLTEMKLVHRDLAARNVLLTKDLVCKISDFGLTRDIYEDDAYLKRSKGRVPIKWMALESLEDQVYTTKSDVWSFGILLWELVTFCSSPYPGVPPQNLFKLLQDGYRMERPTNCSIELYAVMRACWAKLPVHRPSFAALVTQLDAMLSADREYLDLAPSAVENRQYMEERQETLEDGEFQWQFQGYDVPKAPCCCTPEHCTHAPSRRYENELKTFHNDLWHVPGGENASDIMDKKDLAKVIKV